MVDSRGAGRKLAFYMRAPMALAKTIICYLRPLLPFVFSAATKATEKGRNHPPKKTFDTSHRPR